MNLERLNKKIEGNNFYKFMIHHKKVINIIQGIFIIGLLIGINTYVVKDHFIKKQIKDNCGYSTSRFECVCEKTFVDNWKALQRGEELNLHLNDTSPEYIDLDLDFGNMEDDATSG